MHERSDRFMILERLSRLKRSEALLGAGQEVDTLIIRVALRFRTSDSEHEKPRASTCSFAISSAPTLSTSMFKNHQRGQSHRVTEPQRHQTTDEAQRG